MKRENGLTRKAVADALREVIDPELGLSLVDLGLIYDIRVEGGKVSVTMTLTSPGCPLAHSLLGGVEGRLMLMEDVNEVQVDLVWNPPWHPSAITNESSPKARNADRI